MNEETMITKLKESLVRKLYSGALAVEEVNEQLRDKSVDYKVAISKTFVANGVVDALCTGFATSDERTICEIFKIFEQLVDFNLLATWHEIEMSLQAILRVIHVFLATKTDRIVACGLRIVQLIIERIRLQKLQPSLLNVPLVLNVLYKVSMSSTKLMNQQILSLIVTLLEGEYHQANVHIFISVIAKIMKDSWYHDSDPITISKFIIFGFEFLKNNLKDSFDVVKLSIDIVETVLLKYLVCSLEENTIHARKFEMIDAIYAVFSKVDDEKKFEIALMLTANRFLSILQAFENVANSTRRLLDVTRRFLIEVLSNLSVKLLDSETEWSEKLFNALSFLRQGTDYKRLFPLNDSPDRQILPILFNYFYFHQDKKAKADKELFDMICKYVADLNEYSAGLLKAVWFVLVFASTNKKTFSAQYNSSAAKLVRIMSHFSVKLFLTRHPIMVLWTFKSLSEHSLFKESILDEILSCHDDCTKELQEIFASHAPFRIMCLNYLAFCGDDSKVNILTTVLFNDKIDLDAIFTDVSHFLPRLISSRTFVRSDLRNLNIILKYALTYFSSNFGKVLTVEIATALVMMISFFFKHSTNFNYNEYYFTMEFISCLFNKNEGKECVGEYVFDDGFFDAIEYCLNVDSSSFCFHLLNILIPLLSYQENHTIEKRFKKIGMRATMVIKWLQSSKTIARLALRLLCHYFSCVQTSKCILNIVFKDDDLISLYLELHDVCLKDEAYTQCTWRCLLEMLLYCKSINQECYLVTLIHTNDLIDQSVMTKYWPCALEFFKVWILLLPSLSANRYKKTANHTTISKVAQVLTKNCKNQSEVTIALMEVFNDVTVVQKILSFI